MSTYGDTPCRHGDSWIQNSIFKRSVYSFENLSPMVMTVVHLYKGFQNEFFLITTFLFSSLFLLHHSISIKLHIFKIVPSFCQILNRKSFRYSLYLILHHSTKDQSVIQSYRINL